MDAIMNDVSTLVNDLLSQAGSFVSTLFDGMPIGAVVLSVVGVGLFIIFILALFDAL